MLDFVNAQCGSVSSLDGTLSLVRESTRRTEIHGESSLTRTRMGLLDLGGPGFPQGNLQVTSHLFGALFWGSLKLVDTVNGCEIHFAPPKKPRNDSIPLQIPTNNGFPWFRRCQGFVHPQYGEGQTQYAVEQNRTNTCIAAKQMRPDIS